MPIGLGAGRLGNFINLELWGRQANLPWAFKFPDGSVRHASTLYEFMLEGCLLFLILWIYTNKQRPEARVSGLFLVTYGIFRLISEFFREPDAHIGFLFANVTMGQLLSLPMILLGLYFLLRKMKLKR